MFFGRLTNGKKQAIIKLSLKKGFERDAGMGISDLVFPAVAHFVLGRVRLEKASGSRQKTSKK